MRIEQLSIKTLTVSLLLLLALVAAILTLIAGAYFRESALTAQARSLSRIVKIASVDTLNQIRKESTGFGATFQSRATVRSALGKLQKTGDTAPLVSQLDDSFLKGFAGVGAIDLAKLRIYDLNLGLLCESSEGINGLAPQLPAFLKQKASGRTGVERMKALDGLWLAPDGPLYSMLLPLGGIHIIGYMEVVVNPNFNLAKIAALTQMPLKAYHPDGKLVYQSEQNETAAHGMTLPVEYLLKTESGELAYRLVSQEEVAQFNNDMRATQNAITLAFLAVTGIALVLALLTFTRLIFRPIGNMMDDINRYSSEGKLTVSPNRGNTKEFHALSDAFADMAGKIQRNIQYLERLSRLDGLTGVANRRCLDLALEREWRRTQRDRNEISLLLLDIDHFKKYNDHFGHQAGDDCLKLVAGCVAQVVSRPGDLVARYGGEEFAVLLPATSSAGAATIATQILDEIARLNIPHPESAVSNIVTISIGVSTLGYDESLSTFHLVGLADEALYRAKKSGRNQMQIARAEDNTKLTAPKQDR